VRIPRLKRRERQALPARRSIRRTRGVCTPLLHVHTRRTRTPADSQARPQLAASAAAALAAVINGVCWPGPPHTRTRTCRVSRYEEFLKVPVRIPADPDATIKTRERQCAPTHTHICTGTGPAPATSAPGLGSPQPHLPPRTGLACAVPARQWIAESRAALRRLRHTTAQSTCRCATESLGPLRRPLDRQAAGNSAAAASVGQAQRQRAAAPSRVSDVRGCQAAHALQPVRCPPGPGRR
jgi:hypothetical protein